ncbi:hypothetical protein BHE74_00037044 [Ensete ventricosum]|nr:hypothetical protein BHE74_00037044 [Ensete ventricosum]
MDDPNCTAKAAKHAFATGETWFKFEQHFPDSRSIKSRRSQLLVFTIVTTVAAFRRRRCYRSSPSLLPLVAVAAAPLALGQVSSSPRFYCSPMPLPLLLGAALSKQLSLCASPRPYLSLLLT